MNILTVLPSVHRLCFCHEFDFNFNISFILIYHLSNEPSSFIQDCKMYACHVFILLLLSLHFDWSSIKVWLLYHFKFIYVGHQPSSMIYCIFLQISQIIFWLLRIFKGTPWVSPIVTPPATSGDVRLCVDMKESNKDN